MSLLFGPIFATAFGALMLTAEWLIVDGPATPMPLWAVFMTVLRIPAVLGVLLLALGAAILVSTRRGPARPGVGLARAA